MFQNAGIFRQKALDKLSSPEQLDQLMQVTNGKSWLALVGVGGLILAGGLWGVFGTVPVEVSSQGVLIRQGGISEVAAPAPGQVTRVLAQPGEEVKPGQPVARVRGADGKEHALTAVGGGRVLEIHVGDGSLVERGTQIATLDHPDRPLHAAVYVPIPEGRRLKEGTEVRIVPTGARAAGSGAIRGKVNTIGEFPVTRRRMESLLKNDGIVEALDRGGPQLEVLVEVPASGGTESAGGLSAGTLAGVTFELGEKRPISFVLPSAGGE